MANPTTAKPTTRFAELLGTAATVGELMRCFDPMLASGNPRDVVGNVAGEPFCGNGGMGTGHPPALVPGAFTFNGLSDPVYRFTAGSTSIRYPSRGWAALALNRTFFLVFRPLATAGPTSRQIPIWGTGADNGFSGIGVSVSTAGVITLGRYASQAVTSSTVTLTSGKTYLVSMTRVTTTTALFNVYCYDDQAYLTPAGTGTTVAVTNEAAGSAPDAVLNPGVQSNGYDLSAFIGDVYTCGLSDATFDPATNGYFAALVADPCAAARGSYTSTGALAAGGVTMWDETTGAVTVHSNRPTLGAAGDQDRYQYRLHRGALSGFTPDATTRIGALQNSPVLTDATAAAGTSYWYKAEQTDGTTTVYSTTATTNHTQTSGRLSKGDFFFGVIADSRWTTPGANNPLVLAACLRAWGYRSGFWNMGLTGTSVYNSGTPANSWQPNTTQDPVNGQASTTLLANAMAAFAQALPAGAYVVSTIGVNDGPSLTTAAAFATRYGYVNAIVQAAGYKQVLVRPYLTMFTSETVTALVIQYVAQIAAMANGTTIFTAGTLNTELGETGIEVLARDVLHHSYLGFDGFAVAKGVHDGVLGGASGGGARGGLRLGL